MRELPDTPAWQELQRRAADGGVLGIALRDGHDGAAGTRGTWVVDVTWPGGEIETLRLSGGGDLDALANALARELRIPLDRARAPESG